MPPFSPRVGDRASEVTKSSIFFRFNCSWFSDVNGAIRFFTVVVTESKGNLPAAGPVHSGCTAVTRRETLFSNHKFLNQQRAV